MPVTNMIEAAVAFIAMAGAVRALVAARIRGALGADLALEEAAKGAVGFREVKRRAA